MSARNIPGVQVHLKLNRNFDYNMASHLVSICTPFPEICNLRMDRPTSSVLSKIVSIALSTTKCVSSDNFFLIVGILTRSKKKLDWCMPSRRSLLEKAHKASLLADDSPPKCIPQPSSWPCLQAHRKRTPRRFWCSLWGFILRTVKVWAPSWTPCTQCILLPLAITDN